MIEIRSREGESRGVSARTSRPEFHGAAPDRQTLHWLRVIEAMQLGWRSAFLYMTREPGWWRKLLVGGALLLACPPLGWPLALGYRREVALRLVRGGEPTLPEWGGVWSTYLASGLGA